MASINKQSDRMDWGITLLLFGVIYLIHKTRVADNLPLVQFLTNPGTYFLVAGIVFLIYRKEKTLGIILTAIGLIIHSDLFFGWMKNYSNLIVPIVLIVVGGILILAGRKNR